MNKYITVIISAFIMACSNAATKETNAEGNQQTTNTVNATSTQTTKEKGTIFFDLTLEEALKKAKAENKYVLINFHSTTCGPCRQMEKKVFPLPECGEYINKKFIPIMVDGEDEGYGTELAKQHKIFIYPTYLVFTADYFKVGEITGAEYEVNYFLDMLKTIVRQAEK